MCTALNFHPWLQQCYLDLCGTLNDTLDPAFNQQWRTVRMKELLEFALNHAALKFNGNEVSCAVQQSRGSHNAWFTGTHDCGDIQWIVGRGIRAMLVRTELLFGWSFPIFSLPADSLCKPEATEQKSGSTLTTHLLIPDFWSVSHILINCQILREYVSGP